MAKKIPKIRQMKGILKKYAAEFAFLHGSHLNQSARQESDIDLAVYLPPKLSKRARFQLRIRLISDLEKLLKKPVDLLILNDLQSIEFKFFIELDGKLIYCQNRGSYLDYAVKVMSEYFDFKPFIDEYNKQYVARIA